MKGFTNWKSWKKLLGIILALGLTACNSGTSGDTGTVTPPPSDGGNGGGGNPPPPPTTGTYGYSVEVASATDQGPQILVLPGKEEWGDSYDAFIFKRNTSPSSDGWVHYSGRVERPRSQGWGPGRWYLAAHRGDNDGNKPEFIDCGHNAQTKCYINGQLARAVVVGHNGPPDNKVHAHINHADRHRHAYFVLSEDGEISLDRSSIPSDDTSTPYLIDDSGN